LLSPFLEGAKISKFPESLRIVFVEELRVNHFKNFSSLHLIFSPHLNVITGENGAGKTNLLDAIHYICFGKSYFSISEQTAIKLNENFFRLEGIFNVGGLKEKIACVLQSGKTKTLSHDGIDYKTISEHLGKFPVIVIAPDDLELVNGSSLSRRNFADATISQTSKTYLQNLIQYHKAITQRNALLKSFFENKQTDNDLLNWYDEQLIQFGKPICDERIAFTNSINPYINNFYKKISNGGEAASIRYESVLMEHDFKTVLKQNHQKDYFAQRTTAGIHRDDWELKINELDLKKFGSQGQKKSFLVALKLSEFLWIKNQINKTPILIIDDLSDKLDKARLHQLLNMLSGDEFGQIFISETNQTPLPGDEMKLFHGAKFFTIEKPGNIFENPPA
jgi:DNA replication and repair protein RecF